MCGIFGNITRRGLSPSIDDATAIRLRDLLTHRGPDGAGLWRHENALLAHRRLAIIDPTPAGAQPMATVDGRYVITYNGELYNDAACRKELADRGVTFRSHCDTETVLEIYAAWGIHALDKLRGMYAFAVYDTHKHTLLLARDPLGVKPLYFWHNDREVVFASEPAPVVSHPGVPCAPDLKAMSAYCTTIRSVLGERTIFEGVSAVRPGEAVLFEFAEPTLTKRIITHWRGPQEDPASSIDLGDAGRRVWSALEDSVMTHLRSDVPICALLSGGIDSAATSAIASGQLDALRTYCAGAPSEDQRDDLHTARLVAKELGTSHAEAVITRESFARDWPAMVRAMGMPLSTPNEVAIHAVASRLLADGCIVTISGEGADELLAGYESTMDDSARFVEAGGIVDGAPMNGGVFQLHSNSWIPVQAKGALFEDPIANAIDNDSWLLRFVSDEFDRCAEETGDATGIGLASHLQYHRRMNLTGLLRRLDSATMLASVEGRTPFADREVASICEALPIACKYAPPQRDDPGAGGGAGVLAPPIARTKLALRRACEGKVPEVCINRPKASFPLPFQSWIADQAPALRSSPFAREVFSPAAVELVSADPSAHWRLAWPMLNLAMWGDRWFV